MRLVPAGVTHIYIQNDFFNRARLPPVVVVPFPKSKFTITKKNTRAEPRLWAGQTAYRRAQRARHPPRPPNFACSPQRLHGGRRRRARVGRRRRRGGRAPGRRPRLPPRARLGDGGAPRRAPAELRLPLRLPRLPCGAEPPKHCQHGRCTRCPLLLFHFHQLPGMRTSPHPWPWRPCCRRTRTWAPSRWACSTRPSRRSRRRAPRWCGGWDPGARSWPAPPATSSLSQRTSYRPGKHARTLLSTAFLSVPESLKLYVLHDIPEGNIPVYTRF